MCDRWALSLAALAALSGCSRAEAPTVVVFAERGFPYFGANQAVSPRIVAEILTECGLDARLVGSGGLANALRDPNTRALVWCYGNTFPRNAEAAITEFHQRSGCLIATGAPFTHPCVREDMRGKAVWRDEGHEDHGQHDRVGIGQVGGSVPVATAQFAGMPDAPFCLDGLQIGQGPFEYPVPAGTGVVFFPGKGALAEEDELIGMVGVGDQGGPRGCPVAAIKHHCPRFPGAVDVWAGTQWLSDPRDPGEVLVLRQLLVRSTIWALREAGALDAGSARKAEQAVGEWMGRVRLPARTAVPFRPRTSRRLFPRSPRVSPKDEVIVHSVNADDQSTRVALACLQGLVNRERPRLYLVYSPHDEQWLQWYQERGYVGQKVRQLEAAADVVKLFRQSAKGAVLVEDRFRNIGTMVASVQDGVVCTEQQAQAWGLPVIDDLRARWKADAEAYEWAFRTLWPQMRHDVLCSGHPERSTQQTDYLVAQRIFTFFISGGVDGADEGKDPVAETAFAEKLFAAEPHSPVMGWWGWNDPPEGIGEYWGMTLASRYAKLTIGTDFLTNMTFHSGIPAPNRFRQPQIDRLPRPAADPSKVYVSISVLDSGNDPWYWLRPQREVWDAPGRGVTPTGWIIGTSLLDLAPGITEWYYAHLTDRDELICGLSGLGYMNVPDYGTANADRGRVLDEYLRLTQEYLDRMDLRTVQTYHGSWGERSDFAPDGDLALFARRLKRVNAYLPDIGRHDATTPEIANHVLAGPEPSSRVPVFHCLTRCVPWTLSGDLTQRREDGEVANLVAEVRKMTPQTRPGFMSVFALSWTFKPEMINRAAVQLGDPYVFVTPSQLAQAYTELAGER
jgi:hypothetical protein